MPDASNDVLAAGERLLAHITALHVDVAEIAKATDNGRRLPFWVNDGADTPPDQWAAEKLGDVFTRLKTEEARFRCILKPRLQSIRRQSVDRPPCVANGQPFATASEGVQSLAGDVYFLGIVRPFLKLVGALSSVIDGTVEGQAVAPLEVDFREILDPDVLESLLVKSEHPHLEVLHLLDELGLRYVKERFYDLVAAATKGAVEPVEALAVEFRRECALTASGAPKKTEPPADDPYVLATLLAKNHSDRFSDTKQVKRFAAKHGVPMDLERRKPYCYIHAAKFADALAAPQDADPPPPSPEKIQQQKEEIRATWGSTEPAIEQARLKMEECFAPPKRK